MDRPDAGATAARQPVEGGWRGAAALVARIAAAATVESAVAQVRMGAPICLSTERFAWSPGAAPADPAGATVVPVGRHGAIMAGWTQKPGADALAMLDLIATSLATAMDRLEQHRAAVDRMQTELSDARRIAAHRPDMEAALKRIEAKFAAQTERFRIAQRAGGVGLFEWYPETGAMDVSDEFRKMWGLSPEELVTADLLLALVHPDDRQVSAAARYPSVDNPLSASEYRIRRRDDGVERWIARRGERLDGRGGRRRYVGVTFDITERKHAEALVRESEQRFRLIADSAPVPIWVTVAGGGAREFVNNAYCEFLGVDRETALTFDWRTRIHAEDLPRIFAEQVAGEASGAPFTLEARYLNGAGEWRWLRSVSQPRWGSEGDHDGFIGVAHDITAARQAEQELRNLNERLEERVAIALNEKAEAEAGLRQAQKMEAVGRLTGGIAHDFNNLLTPVMGGLEMIADRVTDPRVKRLATNALAAAQRGARLTGQLLAFSRTQRLSIAAFDVNAVVRDMIELVRGTVGQPIKVEVDLAPGLAFAMGDANQLENAILNLVINARDAMPQGGTLTISSGLVALPASIDNEAGDFVALTLRDSGAGMSAEVLARATEPFFTTKATGQGTGLGLAQVYGVARQSGGTVAIESEPGLGTAVRILLPVAPAGADLQVADLAPAGVAAREPIDAAVLVIDDDASVRAFLAESIESLGCRVRVAGSGDEGLALLDEARPDLVVVDYAMAGMTGAEFATQARALCPDLPIMVVTGHSDSGALAAALGDRARILKKPFALADLAGSIVDTIRR